MNDNQARITIVEENREEFLNHVCDYLVYLDESLELTFAEYVKEYEPRMRAPRFFGLREPYWTKEESPNHVDIDEYRVYRNEYAWRLGDSVERFHHRHKRYWNTILEAHLRGDVVHLSQEEYDELTNLKEAKSWYSSI